MISARPKIADNHDIAISNRQDLIALLYRYIALKIDFIGAKSRMGDLFVSGLDQFGLVVKANILKYKISSRDPLSCMGCAI